MTGEAGLPPGWYPHQQTPGALRYWDGANWTDNYAPMGAPAAPQRAAQQLPDWFGVMGWLAMILFPVGGVIIGAIHIAKNEVSDGVLMVAGSLIAGIVWFFVLANSGTTYY